MITIDTLYREVQQNFRDMREDVSSLHKCVEKLEDKIDTHIEVGKALQKQKEDEAAKRDQQAKKRDHRFYLVIGGLGVVFSIYEVFSNYFL